MKTIIFLLFLSVNCFAQDLKYSDMATIEGRSHDWKTYTAKDGTVYKIGDKLTIGVPSSNKTFTFITDHVAMNPAVQLGSHASGFKTEIKSIWIIGNKREGYQVALCTKAVTALSYYMVKIDLAVENGEIVSNTMTSDKALSELKKAKDKLDLGLISQTQYDSTKTELARYIK